MIERFMIGYGKVHASWLYLAKLYFDGGVWGGDGLLVD